MSVVFKFGFPSCKGLVYLGCARFLEEMLCCFERIRYEEGIYGIEKSRRRSRKGLVARILGISDGVGFGFIQNEFF